jgi:uncharacterized OB-fold protein
MSALRHAGEYRGPAPVVHPETEPFWRGLGEGRLELQQCDSCATIRFPVAPVCWNCGSLDHSWTEVPTEGTVSAAVTVRRATGDQRWAESVPFVSAQVDMEGGRRMPGRVIADADADISHGTPVRAAYLSTEDGYGVLCFVPREDA